MRVCVVSFKECWPDEHGRWHSYGGFPLQMAAIGSIFDAMTLVVVRGAPRAGGIPLPAGADVVPLRAPAGVDARRKLSVVARLPYYVGAIGSAVRRADAVHAPLPGDIALLGMLVALGLRKPLVARYGGSWVATSATTMMNRVTRGCMRAAAGGRNVMLATGEGDAPPAPGMSWIFSTALAESELARIDPDVARAPARPPRLIYAGRLSPEKGVAKLLRALAALRDARGEEAVPSVVLAGDGVERGALEALARQLGCARHVRFAGQLDRAMLSCEMRRADVCVQPSLTEGFSKAWLDAMAHGLPVLASSVGAARAVVGGEGERGWLVPPGDVPALTAALAALADPALDWRAIRERCRAYVESRTLEAWAREIGERCARQWKVPFTGGRVGS